MREVGGQWESVQAPPLIVLSYTAVGLSLKYSGQHFLDFFSPFSSTGLFYCSHVSVFLSFLGYSVSLTLKCCYLLKPYDACHCESHGTHWPSHWPARLPFCITTVMSGSAPFHWVHFQGCNLHLCYKIDTRDKYWRCRLIFLDGK